MEILDRMFSRSSGEDGPYCPLPPSTPPADTPDCGKEMSCEEKKALLAKIRACVFALTEARLFLDTHPEDRRAIAYYREHKEMLCGLEEKWEKCTGEVVSENGSRWTWVDTPWPWQSEM